MKQQVCLNVSVLKHLCCCWIPSNLLAWDVQFEGGVDSLPKRFKIKRGKRFKAGLKFQYFIKSVSHVLHSCFYVHVTFIDVTKKMMLILWCKNIFSNRSLICQNNYKKANCRLIFSEEISKLCQFVKASQRVQQNKVCSTNGMSLGANYLFIRPMED